MAFEDCPILKYVAPKLYYFFAFRFYRSTLLTCAVPYSILVLGQCLNIIYGEYTSKLDLILRLYLIVQISISTVRAWITGFKSNKMINLFEEIDEVYKELYTNSDVDTQIILKRYTYIAKILFQVNFASVILTIISFNTRPILTKAKDHPFAMYIPTIDQLDTPYFEIIYAFQLYCCFTGLVCYTSIGNMLLCLVIFGIVRLKVLQHKLRNLSSIENKEDKNLEKCFKMHIEILNYVGKINNTLTYLALFEFLCSSLLFCTMLYMMAIGSSQTERLLISLYIIMNLIQSFELYYFANKLRDESILLQFAVYENPWYKYPIKIQKSIWLFCMGSARPMEIMIGNISPMSLGTFQSILNASYSYFNLLRSGEARH